MGISLPSRADVEMRTYVERRRGTLHKYLEKHRKELMEQTKLVGRHNKEVKKILWWEQKFITKEEMEKQ